MKRLVIDNLKCIYNFYIQFDKQNMVYHLYICHFFLYDILKHILINFKIFIYNYISTLH